MTMFRMAGARTTALLTLLLLLNCTAVQTEDRNVAAVLDAMDAESVESAAPDVWKRAALFDPASITPSRKDEAAQLWERFRAAHPLSFQGIAVSKMRADGLVSIVITEPPPHVSFDDLARSIDGASVMQARAGHDGALFDVVGTLSGGATEIVRKLSVLQLTLFRTDHGAFVYEEPFERDWEDARKYKLDLQVTAEEIHAWATNRSTRFEAVRSGEVMDAAAVVGAAHSAVYRLVDAHLIGWWIPKRVAISSLLREIREFAVESDVVVGALAQPGGLMIFGRERIAQFEFLPPLRAETVALLAAVRNKPELAQSFQRTLPGAGPHSFKWDWAPILLSPELVDSEPGQLLNEADPMLKSWSQRGLVEYEGFDYDQPSTWPFEAPVSVLIEKELGASALTFNWNTNGAGYLVTAGETSVYALHRTGALPISYLPSQNPAQATSATSYEEKAYDWFADQNNPVLVRVAQYSALFSIFHALRADVAELAAPAIDLLSPYDATMKVFWSAVDALGWRTLDRLASTTTYQKRIEATTLPEVPTGAVGLDIVRRLY
jgi:hypothetical protein